MSNDHNMESKSKRQARIREYAAPQPVGLGRSQEVLYRYFERLGRIVYGPDWRRSLDLEVSAGDHEIHPIGSEKEKASVIYDHILSGLQDGMIVAFCHVEVIVEASVRDGAADSLYYDDEDLVEDDGAPKERKFNIKKEFWKYNPPRIRANSSTVKLDPKYLVEGEARTRRVRSPIVAYGSSLLKEAEILIKDPDLISLKILNRIEIPDNASFDRYNRYRSSMRLEILAAGWRYLAMSGDKKRVKEADLARHLQSYIETHDLKAKERTSPEILSACKNMAANMLLQLENEDRSVSALVSSSTRERG